MLSPYDTFLRAWRLNRAHHAWLIVGQETLADKIIHTILPKESPFLLRVDKKDTVKSARARWHAFFQLREENCPRVCFVSDIDELGPFIQNALLKLLEEPPENAYFIITSTRLGFVPPTIRSRCVCLMGQGEEKDVEQDKKWRVFWQSFLQKDPVSKWFADFLTLTTHTSSMDAGCRVLIAMLHQRSVETLNGTHAAQALAIEQLIEQAFRLNIQPKSLFFEIGRFLEIV